VVRTSANPRGARPWAPRGRPSASAGTRPSLHAHRTPSWLLERWRRCSAQKGHAHCCPAENGGNSRDRFKKTSCRVAQHQFNDRCELWPAAASESALPKPGQDNPLDWSRYVCGVRGASRLMDADHAASRTRRDSLKRAWRLHTGAPSARRRPAAQTRIREQACRCSTPCQKTHANLKIRRRADRTWWSFARPDRRSAEQASSREQLFLYARQRGRLGDGCRLKAGVGDGARRMCDDSIRWRDLSMDDGPPPKR